MATAAGELLGWAPGYQGRLSSRWACLCLVTYPSPRRGELPLNPGQGGETLSSPASPGPCTLSPGAHSDVGRGQSQRELLNGHPGSGIDNQRHECCRCNTHSADTAPAAYPCAQSQVQGCIRSEHGRWKSAESNLEPGLAARPGVREPLLARAGSAGTGPRAGACCRGEWSGSLAPKCVLADCILSRGVRLSFLSCPPLVRRAFPNRVHFSSSSTTDPVSGLPAS